MKKPYVDWTVHHNPMKIYAYEAGFHVNGEDFILHSSHKTQAEAAEAIAAAIARIAAAV